MAGTSNAKIYSVGIYARLSVEGDDRKNESIETQIEIAKDFMKNQDDMVLYDCYTDLGKSGTNFAREGFERMMQDVRLHRIDCIIVKDLSRFGRNHIETGNYIEKIFPFLGVRFIAVTDQFDSMHVSGENEAFGVNLKNLVNEMYAKDIAVKVKTGKRQQWEQGSYTGGIPAYGYRAEWADGKKCLFPEEITSDIVRKIFELFISGSNFRQISAWLYGQNIVRPKEYRKTGHIYRQKEELLQEWPRDTIKLILSNPVYMGCLIQARTCGKDYKIRSRQELDSEDWSIKEHTHEAIVSEETFFAAADKLEKMTVYCNKKGYSKTVPQEEDIFADVLFCGNCGSKMRRITSTKRLNSGRRSRTYSYACPMSDRLDEFRCEKKRITLNALSGIVREALRQEISLSEIQTGRLLEISQQSTENAKKEWKRELAETERKTENIRKQGSEQYLRYRRGELPADAFQAARTENQKKILSLQKRQAVISEKLHEIDRMAERNKDFLCNLLEWDGKTELTPQIIKILIRKIQLYPDLRMKITFAFRRKSMMP